MTAKKTVRQHARERGALDGADAQALEHALAITERERDEARRSALDFERALYGSRAMYRELEGRIRDLLRIDAGSGDDD